MAKVKLTAGRIAGFKCDTEKAQDFLWCDEVHGLGIRATKNEAAKAYIYQAKVDGKSMRLVIGKVSIWLIPDAQAEARRLQVLIDKGEDPRVVKSDKAAAKILEKLTKELAAVALAVKEGREAVTVSTAYHAYVAERSTSIKDGKLEWGERHHSEHLKFIKAGGVKRTRGRRPNDPEFTQDGILVPLMSMRLIDLDTHIITAWLEQSAAQSPALAALAFRILRAFIAWCATRDAYKHAVKADICQSADVKRQVPSPQVKKNDCLRRAQIKPWFEAVRKVGNPVITAYLQCLLLTGARRNELAALHWRDVDFQWKSLTIRDKVEGERTIPLTPYTEYLISALPRRNEFVFSSTTSASGRLEEPRLLHNKALAAAALPSLTLHGLRRSFGTLSEWVEVPAGVVAQLMGHKPSAIAEKHYIQRELDLLHLWHIKIEVWILEQAGIEFIPMDNQQLLRIIKNK
ncbi:MAG: tyrosine-type recombinase/integrase [Methylococcaceae bacterium]